jgi:peptidyl-tRNA hydrolase
MRVKFEKELRRFNKFQRTVLGAGNPKVKHEDTDPKVYAKYILKEGTNEEKREIMGCFKTKLKILKGIVEVEN